MSFPPGTKGSPTADAANAKQQDESTAAEPTKSEDVPSTQATESARAADAASSPESTVPSANTPAVHDGSSTDTSPDHEESHFEEPTKVEEPAPTAKESEADGGPAQQHDAKEMVESAEDQLLRESSAAVATPEVAAPAAPEKEDKKEPEATKESAPPQQKSEEPKPEAPDVTKSVEIPDSREDSPERMQVDAPADAATPTEPVKETSQERPKTPVAAQPAPTEASQGPQRAVTRVSSGAMRPRSVNEIVGGPSRQTTLERPTPAEGQENQLTPLTQMSQSPVRSRPMSSGRKDRPKGAVSAVLFGKQPKKTDDRSVVEASKEPVNPSDDYFTPLFIQGFTRSSNWMQPFEKLLYHANKTVNSSDAGLAIQDHQACKLLHRVYHLQNSDKWSLRQPKRCPEPTRQAGHWDVVLKEIKWMRTDFREERKWKTAIASKLAQACADWVAATPEERKDMQVAAVIPPKQTDDVAMEESTADVADEPTPELISGDAASPQVPDELSEVFPETVSPSQIFTLAEDDVVFGLRKTPAAFQILDELPMYGPPLKVPRVDPLAPEFDPDAHWRRPALPLSKYVEGPMKLVTDKVPRSKSRYAYSDEESDDEGDGFVNEQVSHAVLPPPTDEVSLFRPEMKHIRDRLHAGHQFRPPTDHQMPMQSFYENRFPSMWTTAEDDELRSQVRLYSYNWPLISSVLTGKSMYASGAERRTPWECFERWIQLEGLPSDMQKTAYFRTYSGRIDAASRIIAQQQMAQQNATGQPVRRRPTVPCRVERRRNNKHLTLIDAMRKLAKKRETQLQKAQQTTAHNAATKKPSEPLLNKCKNPAEFSRERWERDQRLAERLAQVATRNDATRRVRMPIDQPDFTANLGQAAIMQARQQGQPVQGQAPGTPGTHAMQNGQQPNGNGANGQPRPNTGNRPPQARMPMQVPQNGMQPAQQQMMQAQLQNQQAQMQQMQGQQRMPMAGHQQQQPDANMMLQAQRISQQQRQAVQMQHAQGQPHPQQQQLQQQQGGGTPRPPSAHTQHGSPPPMNGVNGMNGMNMNGANHQAFLQNNQAALAAYQQAAANGHTNPPPNMYINNAASPGSRPMQMPQGTPNLQQQLASIEAHVKSKNPKLTNEQARNQAMGHLQSILARQSAMSAAAGVNGQPQQAHAGLPSNVAATTSPHQYAAMLRQHQQQQAAAQQQAQQQQQQQTPNASSPGQSSHHRQSSEGATPGAVA